MEVVRILDKSHKNNVKHFHMCVRVCQLYRPTHLLAVAGIVRKENYNFIFMHDIKDNKRMNPPSISFSFFLSMHSVSQQKKKNT